MAPLNAIRKQWQLEHMTDAPPEIDQYNDNHKIAVLQKWHSLQQNAQKLFATLFEWFLKGNS